MGQGIGLFLGEPSLALLSSVGQSNAPSGGLQGMVHLPEFLAVIYCRGGGPIPYQMALIGLST